MPRALTFSAILAHGHHQGVEVGLASDTSLDKSLHTVQVSCLARASALIKSNHLSELLPHSPASIPSLRLLLQIQYVGHFQLLFTILLGVMGAWAAALLLSTGTCPHERPVIIRPAIHASQAAINLLARAAYYVQANGSRYKRRQHAGISVNRDTVVRYLVTAQHSGELGAVEK